MKQINGKIKKNHLLMATYGPFEPALRVPVLYTVRTYDLYGTAVECTS